MMSPREDAFTYLVIWDMYACVHVHTYVCMYIGLDSMEYSLKWYSFFLDWVQSYITVSQRYPGKQQIRKSLKIEGREQ